MNHVLLRADLNHVSSFSVSKVEMNKTHHAKLSKVGQQSELQGSCYIYAWSSNRLFISA